jgi:hypothetical protein
MKASIAAAKRLGAQRNGWMGFKKNLMSMLGVSGDPMKWDVPVEWQEAFCKANGRKRF